jgi:hypothetical protein
MHLFQNFSSFGGSDRHWIYETGEQQRESMQESEEQLQRYKPRIPGQVLHMYRSVVAYISQLSCPSWDRACEPDVSSKLRSIGLTYASLLRVSRCSLASAVFLAQVDTACISYKKYVYV